jgi:hypothetical protein
MMNLTDEERDEIERRFEDYMRAKLRQDYGPGSAEHDFDRLDAGGWLDEARESFFKDAIAERLTRK